MGQPRCSILFNELQRLIRSRVCETSLPSVREKKNTHLGESKKNTWQLCSCSPFVLGGRISRNAVRQSKRLENPMTKKYSDSYLQIVPLLILFSFFSSSFAQIADNDIPVYSKSRWKLIENDSVTIIKNSFSTKLDTIFKNVYESDSNDSSAIGYYFSSEYKVISIVGSYLSYEYCYNGSGGLHPIGGRWYRTINIDKKNDLSLDSLFTSEVIYKKLSTDTNFTKYLTEKHTKNLSEFIRSLDGGCEISFENLLVSYAITSINNSFVSVQFGLTHGCEYMPEKFTVIKIELPKTAMNKKYLNE